MPIPLFAFRLVCPIDQCVTDCFAVEQHATTSKLYASTQIHALMLPIRNKAQHECCHTRCAL